MAVKTDLGNKFSFISVFEDFVKSTRLPVNVRSKEPFPGRSEIDESIAHAKKDFVKRTVKISDKEKSAKAMKNFDDAVFNSFIDDLIEFFKSPMKSQEDFNEWHKKACDLVMSDFENIFGEEAIRNGIVKQGKAQKLVNMTFKYLYCFAHSTDNGKYNKSCRDGKEECFRYCHMALDSFVLEWIKKEKSRKTFDCHAGAGGKTFKFSSASVPAWSGMDYLGWNEAFPVDAYFEKDEGTGIYCLKDGRYYSYNMLVEIGNDLVGEMAITDKGTVSISGDEVKIIENDEGDSSEINLTTAADGSKRMTPLQAEFIIWPKIKMQLSTEAFIKEVKKDDEKVKTDKSLRVNLDTAFAILKKYCS